MRKINFYLSLMMLVFSASLQAAPDKTQLVVWANEAIVATYTFDFKNYLARQREIAQYFTAAGWTAYSAALNGSKLPEEVQKNSYFVNSVATMPPEIKETSPGQWQATMPLLVVYRNPQYQQKQTLDVTINFEQATAGEGVRGFAIKDLHSKVSIPPCSCKPENSTTTTDSQ